MSEEADAILRAITDVNKIAGYQEPNCVVLRPMTFPDFLRWCDAMLDTTPSLTVIMNKKNLVVTRNAEGVLDFSEV